MTWSGWFTTSTPRRTFEVHYPMGGIMECY
jgi:hypothetical protein